MLQEILLQLWQNKLRTALTGLSVSMGIFLLIFLLGAGNGLIHAFEQNGRRFANDVVRVVPGTTSRAYGGLAKERAISFDTHDISAPRAALGTQLSGASAMVSVSSTFSAGSHTVSGTLQGVEPATEHNDRIKLTHGRFVNTADLRAQRKVIVVPASLAEEFFGQSAAAVGQSLRVDAQTFRIVGVRSNKGDFGSTSCHAPLSTVRTVYGKHQAVDMAYFQSDAMTTPEEAALIDTALQRNFALRHGFSPADQTAVFLTNAASDASEQNSAMNILRTALWVIGLLTLLSGVASISNIMLITVKERTREFGIRKALGARPWSILRAVLLESMVITLLSGYVGLVAGIAATEYLNYKSGEMVTELFDEKFYMFLNPTVDLRIAFGALAVLLVAGLVAGFFPAKKAVSLKPIEALNAK